jgi:hypothetical protein
MAVNPFPERRLPLSQHPACSCYCSAQPWCVSLSLLVAASLLQCVYSDYTDVHQGNVGELMQIAKRFQVRIGWIGGRCVDMVHPALQWSLFLVSASVAATTALALPHALDYRLSPAARVSLQAHPVSSSFDLVALL